MLDVESMRRSGCRRTLPRRELARLAAALAGVLCVPLGPALPALAKKKDKSHHTKTKKKSKQKGHGSGQGQAIVNFAQKFKGARYVWGGESQKGFDCSGLLQYGWARAGVQIPRTTYDQWKAGKPVKNPQPGDAVFFRGSDARGNLPGHVGIYIGNGKFIEAPHTGSTVRVSNLAGRSDYVGARTFG